MNKVFVTGFPGFIGARLLTELLRKDETFEVVALVQPKFLGAAETSRARICSEVPSASSRFALVTGDITQEKLGLGEGSVRSEEITGILHLAAAYDLAISRQRGMTINVEGTQNVIAFARGCRNLLRFDYVSTAYVSGDHRGSFSESDFEMGQKFKNYYEETKYLAEEVVRKERDLPWTIYRPGIVVGDSVTGETSKYDGPYYVMKTMDALPNHFPFPKIGRGDTEVNLVPIDFIVKAMTALTGDRESIGRTIHLTDPTPLRVSQLETLFAEYLGKKFISYPLTPGLARYAMRIGLVRKVYTMPYQLVDYFVHNVHYESDATAKLLAKHKIVCPKFTDYFPNLIKFFKNHKEEQLQGILI